MTSTNPADLVALTVARTLASLGVPLFLARADPDKPTGYSLPGGWQHTRADPAATVLDRWRPGMALCALMGFGLDLIDVDPRDGGSLDQLTGLLPRVYAMAATPSGGAHLFVKSLGIRSRDRFRPGVDYKGGHAGEGHGFAFLAPTYRLSKVDGQPAGYTWVQAPNAATIARDWSTDTSGAALRDAIEAARSTHRADVDNGPATLADLPAVGPWHDVTVTLRDRGRNRGVHDLTAALRGRGGWRLPDVLAHMRAVVWPMIDQAQGGHEFPETEFESTIRAAWDRYPDGDQQRAALALADAEQVTRDGGIGQTPALTRTALIEAYFVARIRDHFTDRVIWVRGIGWHVWDGRKWTRTDVSRVLAEIRSYLVWVHGMALRDATDGDVVKKLESLMTRGRIEALAALVKGEPGVYREASELDSDPDILNAANGIVDLRTGELSLPSPGALCSKLADTAYVPGAIHDDWSAALDAVPDACRDWYQARMGQAITGHMTPDDLIIIQQGAGENGKSTIISAIAATIGDYFLNVSHRALLGDASNHPTELADFHGARLAVLEETPDGKHLDTVRIKTLAGTPLITARKLYQDSATFPASHSLFVSTNYLPQVAETDHGTWRRLAALVFPYRYRKPGDPCLTEWDRPGDPGIRARVISPDVRTAVLAWLVAGARRWYGDGRRMPPLPARVVADTNEWRGGHDHVLGYVTEHLTPDHTSHVATQDLVTHFNIWIAGQGAHPWSAKTLVARFLGHQYVLDHGMIRRRITQPAPGLSRPPTIALSDLPSKYTAVSGARYLSEGDPNKDTGGIASQPSPEHVMIESSSQVDNTDRVHSNFPRNEKPSTREGLGGPCPPCPDDRLITPGQACTESDIPGLGGSPDGALFASPGAPVVPLVALPALVERNGDVRPVALDALPDLGDTVAVDVETTGYPIGHAAYRLRTVQLGTADVAVVLDAADAEQLDYAAAVLANATEITTYSAPADIVPLIRADVVDGAVWDKVTDTALLGLLARPGGSAGLKATARQVLGDQAVSPAADVVRAELFTANGWRTDTDATTPVERSGWAMVDPRSETMARYAGSDALDTAGLARALPRPDSRVLAREQRLQQLTSIAADIGVRIDPDHTRALRQQHESDANRIGAELAARYGVDNAGSPLQVARTFSGIGHDLPIGVDKHGNQKKQPSTDKDALTPLVEGDGPVAELARMILDFRSHNTLLTTFLRPYSVLAESGDGRARPTIYTLGAVTGRMSCARPNLQNVPRVGGVRACLTADQDYAWLSADFAGVEVRVFAGLSGDQALARMILDGEDLHWLIARQVFGPGASKAQRYAVKRVVFGRLYGGQVRGLARQAGISESLTAAAIETLDALTPDLAAFSRECEQAIRRGMKTFTSYSGRVIHLPVDDPRKGPNYIIQGTARELTADAYLKWGDTPWRDCVTLPVHDEINALVPVEDAEHALSTLVECMTAEINGIPIIAEPSPITVAWQDAA